MPDAIQASKPTITPPQPSFIYDLWWVKRIMVDAGNPANVVGHFILQKYATSADGSPQFSPEDIVILTVSDILHNPDPAVQQVVADLLSVVQTLGQKQGIL